MTRRTTIAALDAKHTAERRGLVLSTLERHDWALRPAARDLDVTPSSLQRMIEVLGLTEEYAAHAHGRRGRPAKTG